MSPSATIAAGQNIKERDYWLGRLSGLPDKARFAYDFTRPGREMKDIALAFSRGVSDLIYGIGKNSGYRVHMILTAAVTLLLNKYTGHEDIVIGIPAYRQEGAVKGELINTVLAVRSPVSGSTDPVNSNLSFKQFLIGISKTIYDANENQNYPVGALLYKLGLERGDGEFPLFDVAVLLEPVHDASYLDGIESSLVFLFSRVDGVLSLTLRYNSRRYSERSVLGIGEHLERLLGNALAGLDAPLWGIDVLSEEERKQLLNTFNDNYRDFPREKTIPHYAADRAAGDGDCVAVQYGDMQLTYRQLDEESDRVAGYLAGEGVGEGRILALSMERSHVMAVSVVAVWKSGAAYLPIDPGYPADRVEYILRDSNAVLLKNMPFARKIIKSFSGGPGGRFFKKAPLARGRATAYVIYTSGSTGKPKGTVVEHVGMMNHIAAKVEDLELDRGSVISQNAPHTFDISVWQFFAALVAGGRTVVYPDSVVLDPGLFLDRVCRHRITVLEVVPSYLSVLLEIVEDSPLPLRLKHLLVTGEEVHVPLVEKWFRYYPGIPVVNAYGPTEASDDITHHVMTRAPRGERVPIGVPVRNFILSILNPYMQLCPVGVIGEICVSGIGVGRGYLNRPQLTHETFVRPPAVLETSGPGRLYKTGDLGRWLPDGTIEFFGRKDFQVKVRGFRIEPGEIENRLLAYPGVKEAVVVVGRKPGDGGETGETGGESYLCAYFVAASGEGALDILRLREHLAATLPGYMVPSHLVQLERMPLNAAGKIDRKALPEPVSAGVPGLPTVTPALLAEAEKVLAAVVKDGSPGNNPVPVAREAGTGAAVSPGSEEERLLMEFNNTHRPYPAEKPLHRIFEEQAERTPNRAAVISGNPGESRVSYDRLNRSADILSHRLMERGVVPGTIVALAAGNTIEMVTAIFAILKAGGVYLPIGEDLPAKRIRFILRDSNARVVLTAGSASPPETGPGVIVISLEGMRGELSSEAGAPLIIDVGPERLAHIYYTSGSTGRPRGVAASHGQVHNAMLGLWERIYKYYAPPRHLALLTPFYFDGFLKQTFGALFYGHTLCIVPGEQRFDMGALSGYFRTHAVEISDGSPTLIRMLTAFYREGEAPAGVTHFIISADVLPKEVLGRFFALYSEKGTDAPRVTNLYGPTECCVDSTSFEVTAGNIDLYPVVPIGTPMPNERIYIVDLNNPGAGPEINCVLTSGETGELCIAGDGVSAGYLNRPQLTNERFITHRPTGERLYRTGDLACRLADGNLLFRGRIDHQVQIMGVRIEPREIEDYLLGYPGVEAAVVVARPDKHNRPGDPLAGDKTLCAFLVCPLSLSRRELYDHLQQAFPPVMIPSHFLRIEQLPVSPNGKIRRSLLEVVELPAAAGSGSQPPGSDTERQLAGIWRDVLFPDSGDDVQPGVTENFFDTGGHSLTAVILLSRIQKQMGVKLTLGQLFQAPTIRELAALIPGAAPEGSGGPGAGAPSPTEEREYYPLSSAQRRLYFLHQRAPGIAYNLPQATPLIETGTGDFDSAFLKEKLERTFRLLIARHQGLRTSFVEVDGEPVQVVHSPGDIEFSITGVSPGDLAGFLRPFDLSRAPLLRVGLSAVEKGNLLLLDMHHIISDGFSHQLLTREFTALYKGKELPPLRLHYKDVAAWQSLRAQSSSMKRQERYWSDLFSGGVPVLDLPPDFPRPAVQSFEGNTLVFSFDPSETGRIRELASGGGVTFYMVNLALFTIFLSKIGGTDHIPVGTPVSGRTHADFQYIVGMFVNTLVLYNTVPPHQAFSRFLEQLKTGVLEAFDNQDYPFESMVELLSPRRDPGRNPLFDVMFNYRAPGPGGTALFPSSSPSFSFDVPVSKFDMTWSVMEQGERLTIAVEYCTRLFGADTVRRFTRYFKQLVGQVLQDPGRAIAHIEIISPGEKRQILYEWNATAAPYPAGKTVHRLFSELARQRPDKVALQGNGELPGDARCHLTYGQLDRESDVTAARWRGQGLHRNPIVALMGLSSIETVITLLAVLKTGGAYMFLSPDYPSERVRWILEDSRAVFPPSIAGPPGNPSPVDTGMFARGAAYVAYTSGSTGRPRGVVVSHKNVVRLVKNNRYFPCRETDRLLQTADPAFDASTLEIWGSLLNGLTLYLSSKSVTLAPGKLKRAVRTFGITVMFMTTPLFSRVTEADIEVFSGLDRLFVGGDVMPPPHVRKVGERFPGLSIVNIYGPTENCTVSTAYTVPRGPRDAGANIPVGHISIGKPISNSSAFIVDKHGHLQPVGVPGELVVGGDGVAHGYLNRPGLTREKFDPDLKDLWGAHDHEGVICGMIYRTGDLARWMPDGNIQFLGRVDRQVKINGFRIETGEIEQQLLLHPLIKETVVVPVQGQNNDRSLCAYVVPETGGKDEMKDMVSLLKEHLSAVLPLYMVPALFVPLDEFPLTSSGKIDIARLPEPRMAPRDVESPRSDVETDLLHAWVKHLPGHTPDSIGIFHDFFDIGGNSLKAMQVVSHLMEQYEITIDQLFRYPTIAELAVHIKPRKANLLEKLRRVRSRFAAHSPGDAKGDAKEDAKYIEERQWWEDRYRQYTEKAAAESVPRARGSKAFHHVMLTGATGYLGIYLVHLLLLETSARLYLPVRATSVSHAEQRLRETMTYYFGEACFVEYRERLFPFPAQLHEEHLGCEAKRYRELAETVDTVIHSAANVRHFGFEERFYKDNVSATENLLAFALTGTRKEFHHISTISVGRGTVPGRARMLYTEYHHDEGQYNPNVYARSKFEAEKSVLAYRARGVNASIYRVGNLAAHSRTGRFQENIADNAFYAVLKAYTHLGKLPVMRDMVEDIAFIDAAASALVLLMGRPGFVNETFHLQNEQPFPMELTARILSEKGYEVEPVSPGQFFRFLEENIDNPEKRYHIDRLLLHMEMLGGGGSLTRTRIVSRRSDRILEGLGFQWPVVSEEYLSRMIDYCIKTGFFETRP